MNNPTQFEALELTFRGKPIQLRVDRRGNNAEGAIMFSVYNDDLFRDVYGNNHIALFLKRPWESFDKTNDLSNYSADQKVLLIEIAEAIRKYYYPEI